METLSWTHVLTYMLENGVSKQFKKIEIKVKNIKKISAQFLAVC